MPKPGSRTARSPLADRIRAGAKVTRKEPLWKGPEVDGVTQSMLQKFLVCRERFRLYVVDGLRRADQFEAPIEYGQIWHHAEEAHGAGKDWQDALVKYRAELFKRFPYERPKVDLWCGKFFLQFPEYLKYWEQHPDHVNRKSLGQEVEFGIPGFDVDYRLPSGRMVRLRGKIDDIGVSYDPGKKFPIPRAMSVMDHKTKSSIDKVKINRQLRFDIQMMMYLVAVRRWPERVRIGPGELPLEIEYNVIRRSSHATPESMLKKIQEDVDAGRGSEWFGRWTVPVSDADLQRFETTFLTPILEQLYDWWDMIKACVARSCTPWELHGNHLHWRHPYGARNMMDEGGFGDVDAYMDEGSMSGLQRVHKLFSELSPEPKK